MTHCYCEERSDAAIREGESHCALSAGFFNISIYIMHIVIAGSPDNIGMAKQYVPPEE